MSNEINYISFDEVLEVYQKTIEKSGGGLAGIIYHIAASHIDQELSIRIMEYIVSCQDFDEALKIDIANAMSQGELFNDNEEQKGGADE